MNPAAQRGSIVAKFLKFRRGPWEGLATVIIGLGVVMLMQPFSMDLYTYSFATTLAGTGLFLIVSKFPE